MEWLHGLRVWLGNPETAAMLDPIIFAAPRLIDDIASSLVNVDYSQNQTFTSDLNAIKLTVGISWLLCALALGIYARKKKAHHWWPLVLISAVWAGACIVGAQWQQSIIICAPDGMYLPEVQNTLEKPIIANSAKSVGPSSNEEKVFQMPNAAPAKQK